MRGLEGHTIARSLVRMHLAAIPAAIFALAVTFAVGVVFPSGPVFGIVTLIFGGSGAVLLYVLFAKALGVTELTELTAGLRDQARTMTGPGRGVTCPGPSHREVTVCAGGRRGLRPVGMGGLPWCSAPWSVLPGCWSLRGRGRRVEGLPRS